jgi:hypothetical protein
MSYISSKFRSGSALLPGVISCKVFRHIKSGLFIESQNPKSCNVRGVGTFFDTCSNLDPFFPYNFICFGSTFPPKNQSQSSNPLDIVWDLLRPYLGTYAL